MFNLNITAMYNYENVQTMRDFIKNSLGLLTIGLFTVLLALACQKDPVPDTEKNPNPDQQQEDPKEDPKPEDAVTVDDPDLISEYLVMPGASKLTGSLPQAMDGQLKINVKDTTYAVKGHPIAAARMLIKKPLGLEIASFNIQVGGASYYFNLPAEKLAEDIPTDADSLNVLVLDVQPPDEIRFPLTLDIKIQPVDPSGEPLDEFDRVITVEDAISSDCSTLAPNPCPGQHPINCGGYPNWDWTGTLLHNTQTHIDPDVWSLAKPWKAIGCCIGGGESVFEYQDHRCRPDGNNLEYKELDVIGTGSKRYPLRLGLYDDGEFYMTNGAATRNIDDENMDFCSNLIPYRVYAERGNLGGTHDYSDGDDFINLTFDPSFDTGGFRPFWAGEVVVATCNTLVIREPDPEGDYGLEISHVFRRIKSPEPTNPADLEGLNPFEVIMMIFFD